MSTPFFKYKRFQKKTSETRVRIVEIYITDKYCIIMEFIYFPFKTGARNLIRRIERYYVFRMYKVLFTYRIIRMYNLKCTC